MQTSYKAVIEDSSRNKYMFYYSGSSVCCKEVSKDGVSRDIIISSSVSENFLTAIDLQDNLHVACINKDKGLYLYSYVSGEWKLEQILNIQGSDSIILLSLFAYNGSIHIIYAKQMTIANFFNVYHLYKPSSSNSYHLNTSWRKNNVGEIYSEDINTSYTAIITKDGALHLVYEWSDGSSYQINYSWFDNLNSGWKRKSITTLVKKDITVSLLYEDSSLHLLCYTFEDEVSAIFYYTKKDNTGKDFEFSCLDKIKTEQIVAPYYHAESSSIYVSWITGNRFSQYSMGKDQKNWSKKMDNIISDDYSLQLIQYTRNRKGKALITRKTYYSIDYKNNITLPYFRDSSSDILENYISKASRNAEGDLVRYIPYILDELKSIAQAIKGLQDRMDQLESKKRVSPEYKIVRDRDEAVTSYGQRSNYDDNVKLKKSSFRDKFMNTNKLLNRPDAAALYVGSSAVPTAEELSKKEGIDIVENNGKPAESEQPKKVSIPSTTSVAALGAPISPTTPPHIAAESKTAPAASNPATSLSSTSVDSSQAKHEHDPLQKDTNLFKKIGDFFK